MWEILQSIEFSRFSTWVREGELVLGYTTTLALHSFGMAFLVGLSAMVALRVLGVAPSLPLAPLDRFFPLMWISFWVNAVTGVVLFSLAPTSLVTNAVFGIKMVFVAAAVASVRLLRTNVFGDPATLDTRPVLTKNKALAAASLALWIVAITAGRLTAYPIWIVPQQALAVLIVVVMLIAGCIAARLSRLNRSARQARLVTSTNS